MIHWELLTYMMAIGHGYFYLSTVIKNNKSHGKPVKDYLKKINAYYSRLYDAYYKQDRDIITAMNENKMAFVFAEPEKLMEKHKNSAVLIAKMQYILRITQLCTGSVFYLIVD